MVRRTQNKKVIKDVFLFLLKFNVLLLPFYLIIILDLNFYPLQIAFANFLAFFLKILNYDATTSDFLLFVGKNNYPIDISRDCIGWKSSYSLFALVFATPGDTKDKLKFLGLWIPVLLVINVFRIIITIVIGMSFGIQYMEIIHAFLWEVAIIIILIGIWIIWLRKGKLNIMNIRNIYKVKF